MESIIEVNEFDELDDWEEFNEWFPDSNDESEYVMLPAHVLVNSSNNMDQGSYVIIKPPSYAEIVKRRREKNNIHPKPGLLFRISKKSPADTDLPHVPAAVPNIKYSLQIRQTGQYMKNVKKYKRTKKNVARGNASKKKPYCYTLIGGGARGRKYLGNIKKPPSCPWITRTKMGFNNRLNKKKDAVNAIKFARRNIINRMF